MNLVDQVNVTMAVFEHAVAEAKLDNLHFHDLYFPDLRHHFTSWFVICCLTATRGPPAGSFSDSSSGSATSAGSSLNPGKDRRTDTTDDPRTLKPLSRRPDNPYDAPTQICSLRFRTSASGSSAKPATVAPLRTRSALAPPMLLFPARCEGTRKRLRSCRATVESRGVTECVR